GFRLRDEHRDFTDRHASFGADSTMLLTPLVGGFSDPKYSSLSTPAFHLGPVPDADATTAWEAGHLVDFTNKTDSVGNALSSFGGGERVYAAYAMQDVDIGAVHINLCLRAEV